LRKTKKIYVKIVHAGLLLTSLILGIVGLVAVFDSHNKPIPPIPNMYSLHSWIGLTSVILFGLQWILGFLSFLFPKLSDNFRRFYLPHHKFWGVVIFALCCIAAVIGITEKALFSVPL
jgi:cytochrome b-561